MEWPILTQLADADRRAVLQSTTRRKFRKGDTVCHEGDPGDTLHMIERGHVAVRVSTPNGDIATLTVLGPSDSFGEQALLTADARRTASIVALDPVETLSLHRNDFEALRAQHPHIERFLVGVLTLTVQRLSAQVLEALYVPVDKRVMRRLLALGRLYGPADGGGSASPPIPIPITQEDLASMAGTTRPSANRCLQELVAAGVVDLTRGRITIRDTVALTRRAR